MSSRAIWGLVLAAALLLVVAAIGMLAVTDDEGRNEITLLVDGTPRLTWTVPELMEHRFDWVSPKGHLAPAIPLSAVVFAERTGLTPQSVRVVRIPGQNHALELREDDLALVDRLILRIDFSRGGTWLLHGRDRASSGRMESVGGFDRILKIDRIEIVTAAGTDDSSETEEDVP